MIDLERLKELCAKATAGPWHAYEGDLMTEPTEHGYGPIIGSFNYDRIRFGAPTNGFTSQGVIDSCFVEAARTALPKLIAEVERLDFLHKQDHSLADQWEARNQSLEAKLKLAEEALEKILLRKDECCGGLECACHDDAKDALAQLEEKP